MTQPRPCAWAVSHWWDDEWTGGGWSLLGVTATPDTRRILGTPVGRTLMFAGEATHPEQAAMTHGAYEEGLRAARWAVAKRHQRVIVVGAGAAGLGAARHLDDTGHDVVVLEARDRIGGRTHTVDLAGAPVELGAAWLQQGERNTLAPIARRLDLELVDTDFAAPVEIGTSGPLDRTGHDELLDELRRWLAARPQGDESLGDAVTAWIAAGDPAAARSRRRVVDSEITLDSGAPLTQLSSRFGFEPGVGVGDRWIVGGYRRLLDAIAADLDVRTSQAVRRIDYTGRRVVVHSDGGSLVADAVIVTVPAAVLRAGTVAFDPPLPDTHRDALDALTVGRVEKVALVFDEQWWTPTADGYLRVHGGRPGEISEWLDVSTAATRPCVTGLFAGEWATAIWDGADDESIAIATTEALFRAMSAAAMLG